MSPKILRGNLYLGALILTVSTGLLISGCGFMQIWFYCFAWWSTILILDSLNFRLEGSSLISRSFKNFLILAFVSVSVWLVFELYNLVLSNWSYHLPSERWIRWLGFFISFATVIPALYELADFWKNLFPKNMKSGIFRKWGRISPNILIVTGAVSLILPLLIPRFAFPLIWIGFIFVLDPINYRKGRDSLLGDLRGGKGLRLWSWALAGLTAGILWELFNFWSGSHWVYSLPFFDFGKIFQMPVLGYLGFIPFALEIFTFLPLYRNMRNQIKNHPWITAAVITGLLIFDGLVFYLIDIHTWIKI